MTNGPFRLRKRLAIAKKNRRGRRRYPVDLRQAVVAHARRKANAGISQAQIATELGLSAQTLWSWLRKEGEPAAAAVRPVEVSTSVIPSAAAVVLPSGVRIEVEDEDAAVRIARALS